MSRSTNSNLEESHHLLDNCDSEEENVNPSKASFTNGEAVLEPKMTKLSAYALCRFLASITLKLILRFWALCATGTLILLLLYYLYGGFVSLTLLIVSVLGKCLS